jgi:hypothetical protein
LTLLERRRPACSLPGAVSLIFVHFDQRRAARANGLAGTRVLSRAGALTLAGVLTLTGCTRHHAEAPPPSASAPVSSVDTSAIDLAAVAKLAQGAAYTGSYLADSSDNPPHTNAIKVFRTRLRTRLDITENEGRVLIQVDPTGTFTCKVPATGLASCLTLAGPNEEVASDLDPGGQRLFTTTLALLAAGSGLKVAAAAPRPAVNGIPLARCYALIAAPPGAAPGTYCFTATGILVRAQFRSNVLQLTALGGVPVDSDFTLPVAPLPMSSAVASSSGVASTPASGPASSAAPPSAAASS